MTKIAGMHDPSNGIAFMGVDDPNNWPGGIGRVVRFNIGISIGL